jgi:succinyl-diaminopimelate desuccinylase
MKDTLRELHSETKNDDYLPVVTAFPGYTDTAVIASRLKNGETLSYGPGSLALAHKPDEYVELRDIERCERVYRNLIKYLLI